MLAPHLRKVAMYNGIPPGAWSWRHDSIAKRIAFLERVADDPMLADRFDRTMRRLRGCLGLGLAIGIAVLAWFG